MKNTIIVAAKPGCNHILQRINGQFCLRYHDIMFVTVNHSLKKQLFCIAITVSLMHKGTTTIKMHPSKGLCANTKTYGNRRLEAYN